MPNLTRPLPSVLLVITAVNIRGLSAKLFRSDSTVKPVLGANMICSLAQEKFNVALI